MSLLYKPLESITAADLQGLIDNQVGESLYIEYKTGLFDKRDDKKRLQFLGSVSAFANAAGGDLLVGVNADNGRPVDLPGLDPAEIDSEILRIRQVLGTSIDPHLIIHFQGIPLPTGRLVLIIRVPRSWAAPHGIDQNGHFQFFRRHAAGRSPMTLSELRTAFTLSGGIVDQTRRFRGERLATIATAEGPWNYLAKPLAVLEIVPFASVMDAVNIDLSSSSSRGYLRGLSPLRAQDGLIGQGERRYNLEGVVMRQGVKWHTQLFRNGSIEYATSEYFDQTSNLHHLDAWTFQVNLVTVLPRFFTLEKALGVVPPVTVMLSLLNAANYHLRISEGRDSNEMSQHQIDRDQVFLPEVVVDDFGESPIVTLKPIFDCLWNAAGLEKCRFYGWNGEWKLDPSWLDPPNAL